MAEPLEEDLAHAGRVLSLVGEKVEERPGPVKLVKLFLVLDVGARGLLGQVVVGRGPRDGGFRTEVDGRFEVVRGRGFGFRLERGGRGQGDLLGQGRFLEVRVLAKGLRSRVGSVRHSFPATKRGERGSQT